MRVIKSLPLFLLLIIAVNLTGCNNAKQTPLKISALPVNATLTDSILEGPAALNDPDRFVWGGSVIKGKDGRYHMLYNTFECGDSLPVFSSGWVLHSVIALASSDYPDHGFKFRKIVLKGAAAEGNPNAWDAQMVSNPHIKKFNDRFYLYYIGSKDPGVQPPGSAGEHVDKRNRVQQMQQIGVLSFDNFEDLEKGAFTRPSSPILGARTRVKPNNIVNPSPEGTMAKPDNIIVVNPAVVRRPSDGKYLLYFKGNIYEPHWKGVHGVALADTPEGPFTATDQYVFDLEMEDGTMASAEDPYVWYHRGYGKFLAVFKDFSGRFSNGEPGLAMMESEDGLNWQQTEHPAFMKKQVILQSGDTIKLNRMERPQLLIGEDGSPQVLYCAASVVNINPRKDGKSFNIQIPLKVE